VIDPLTFRVVEFQTSVFTPGLHFLPNRVLPAIIGAAGAYFDASPISLPDAAWPIEVPRLILQSQSGSYRAQIGPARLDIVWSAQESTSALSLRPHLEWVRAIIDAYRQATNAIVGRLACVMKRASPSENAGSELATHFCKDTWLQGPLNRPEDFQLHAHKRFVMARTYTVNSWVRCISARIGTVDQQRSILVEHDLNTLAEELENREFSPEESNRFFESCLGEFDHIFSLYFPSEPNEH
jgi:hypothetical protein